MLFEVYYVPERRQKMIPVISIIYFHSLYHAGDLVLGFVDSKLFLALLGFGLLPLLL